MSKSTEILGEANSLQWIRIASTGEPVKEFSNLDAVRDTLAACFTEPVPAVLWLDDRVEIAVFQPGNRSGKFHLHAPDRDLALKHVQRMRVFSAERELHLWRTSSGWQARLRRDELKDGEPWDVVVARQLLFGTKKYRTGKTGQSLFTSITEDRGTTLHLPLKGLSFAGDNTLQQRVWLTTRSYIRPNSLGQVGYVDCRFVDFCTLEQDTFIPLALAWV